MIKIFLYDCRRLLLNKFFIALLLITGFYSYQILSGEIILGISETAPFSVWSYGAYLAKILPLILITLLFFVTFLYSKKEQMVQTISLSTPTSSAKYVMIRCLVMATGFILISSLCVGVSLIFYYKVFRLTQFVEFIMPILITFVPAFLFTLGVGMLIGRVKPALIYVLMLALFLLGQVTIPNIIDLIGNGIFRNVPAVAPIINGEPVFVMNSSIILGKSIYFAIGMICLIYSTLNFRNEKKYVR